MTWAKLDDGLPDHPKVDALLEEDELRGLAAVGLFALSICRSAQQLTDGALSHRAVRRIAPEHGAELADALRRHSFFDPNVTDAVRIHDFLDYNRSAAEVLERRAMDAQRKVEARTAAAEKRASARTAPGVSARTTPNVQQGVRKTSARPSALPDPTRPDLKERPPLTPPIPGGNKSGRRRDRDHQHHEQVERFARELFPDEPLESAATAVDQALRATGRATPDGIRAYVGKWFPDLAIAGASR